MHVVVKFFAILKERTGISQSTIELADGSSVAAAGDVVGEKFPTIKSFLPRIAYAVNLEYATGETPLHDGDELALIPPVSGG